MKNFEAKFLGGGAWKRPNLAILLKSPESSRQNLRRILNTYLKLIYMEPQIKHDIF